MFYVINHITSVHDTITLYHKMKVYYYLLTIITEMRNAKKQ